MKRTILPISNAKKSSNFDHFATVCWLIFRCNKNVVYGRFVNYFHWHPNAYQVLAAFFFSFAETGFQFYFFSVGIDTNKFNRSILLFFSFHNFRSRGEGKQKTRNSFSLLSSRTINCALSGALFMCERSFQDNSIESRGFWISLNRGLLN